MGQPAKLSTTTRISSYDVGVNGWLSQARGPIEQAAARRCLAGGQGAWLPTTMVRRFYPLLPPSFLTLQTPKGTVLFSDSKWWWGYCDRQARKRAFFKSLSTSVSSKDVSAKFAASIRSSPLAPSPRAELGWAWVPRAVDGSCVALRKRQPVLPSMSALTHAFCKRHAGARILFVGDSVQGQLFTSFASIFAAQEPYTRRELRARPNSWSSCRIERAHQLHPHEIDHSVTLCDQGPSGAVGAVSLRFIRNEGLKYSDVENKAVRDTYRLGTRSEQLSGAGKTMCDWEGAAADADFLVINRGLHFHTDDTKLRDELNSTFNVLNALATRRNSSARGPIKSILYRGTHAAIPNCSRLPDPLPRPWQFPDGYVSPFGWERLERHNKIAHALVGALPEPFSFMDTYYATSLRPGGRRGGLGKVSDCVHFCLPGAMDEWSRLMLALWT